jgi:hypothetical protein
VATNGDHLARAIRSELELSRSILATAGRKFPIAPKFARVVAEFA